METSSYFVDRSQDVLEVLNARMVRLENNAETPAELPAKDHQALKRDHDLVEFVVSTTEDFKKTVKRTQGACLEYFKRLLNTFNRFQTDAEHKLDEFPDHETFREILQGRYQDAEARTQQIKAIDDLVLRNEVGHPAVSVKFLEYQLRLSPARVEAIKNQAEKFDISIQFLEPSTFEGIVGEAVAWRKFLERKTGPSS